MTMMKSFVIENTLN